MVYKILPD